MGLLSWLLQQWQIVVDKWNSRSRVETREASTATATNTKIESIGSTREFSINRLLKLNKVEGFRVTKSEPRISEVEVDSATGVVSVPSRTAVEEELKTEKVIRLPPNSTFLGLPPNSTFDEVEVVEKQQPPELPPRKTKIERKGVLSSLVRSFSRVKPPTSSQPGTEPSESKFESQTSDVPQVNRTVGTSFQRKLAKFNSPTNSKEGSVSQSSNFRRIKEKIKSNKTSNSTADRKAFKDTELMRAAMKEEEFKSELGFSEERSSETAEGNRSPMFPSRNRQTPVFPAPDGRQPGSNLKKSKYEFNKTLPSNTIRTTKPATTEDTISSEDEKKGGLQGLAKFWDEFGETNKKKQEVNPFSDKFTGKREVSRDNILGSKSDIRGKEAQEWANAEMLKVVQVIKDFGTFDENQNCYYISFGELFKIYENISDTLVAMLINGRKKKLLHFSGEMLLQGRDNKVLIFVYV